MNLRGEKGRKQSQTRSRSNILKLEIGEGGTGGGAWHEPFLHLIQADAERGADAGFLLPPLPLHQLLPHQQFDQLLGLVQVLVYVRQDVLRKRKANVGKGESSDEARHRGPAPTFLHSFTPLMRAWKILFCTFFTASSVTAATVSTTGSQFPHETQAETSDSRHFISHLRRERTGD